MKKTILLKNVLQQMRQIDAQGNALPFSLHWRTFNSQNKMGGKLKSSSKAILCMRLEKDNNPNWEAILLSKRTPVNKKNPNHKKNYTINIELSPGEIVKVNVLAIVAFNGMEVVL